MNSINTTAFATKNEIVKVKRKVLVPGSHVIGLDMGYSGPKCYHENGNFVFSNYCQKLSGDLMCDLDKNDMIYEDLTTGDRYSVGNMAVEGLDSETAVSEDILFGRNHYIHPEFKVKLETSLGLALWDVETDGTDVYVQSGLPPAYLTTDKVYLTEVIKGRHKFKLTVGRESKEFDITILKENIDVMIQPMGTLNSLMFDDEGKMQPIARDLAKSNLLIFDAGFGTLDTFFISGKELKSKNTDASLGMKRILTETRSLIENELGVSPTLPAMQKILKTGVVDVNDFITLTTRTCAIDEYLKIANEKVCKEALESIKSYIFNIKYLIMSGGTSEAWIDYFKKSLLGTSVNVIKGSTGANVSNIYSNARGYYYYRTHVEGSKR